MPDREKVIKEFEDFVKSFSKRDDTYYKGLFVSVLALLKEQKQKQIIVHKKHVITWKRDDYFSIGKLYEEVCETLLDEGELIIVRTDDHEKVDIVFYVAQEGR